MDLSALQQLSNAQSRVKQLIDGVQRFAWLPTRLTDGTFCWLEKYWEYYEGYLEWPSPIYSLVRDLEGKFIILKTAFFDERFIQLRIMSPYSHPIQEIIEERQRQIRVKGWTAEHDDEHTPGTLAAAAACYSLMAGGHDHLPASLWPFDEESWKPGSNKRNLIKAGALILAELDRLNRVVTCEGQKRMTAQSPLVSNEEHTD